MLKLIAESIKSSKTEPTSRGTNIEQVTTTSMTNIIIASWTLV